jgi:hypothetical protein
MAPGYLSDAGPDPPLRSAVMARRRLQASRPSAHHATQRESPGHAHCTPGLEGLPDTGIDGPWVSRVTPGIWIGMGIERKGRPDFEIAESCYWASKDRGAGMIEGIRARPEAQMLLGDLMNSATYHENSTPQTSG